MSRMCPLRDFDKPSNDDRTNTPQTQTQTGEGLGDPLTPEKSGLLSKNIAIFAIVVIVIVLPIRIFIAKPFIVSGASMFPSFDTWHYLIIDQLSYRFEQPARGDVIVFRFPQNPSRFFIKRVIALPNETIRLAGTTVTIINDKNPAGFTLEDTYVAKENGKESNMTISLGNNEYFVMGDNRRASADSRSWGALEKERIVGRVFLRLFPFTEIEVLPGETTYIEPNAAIQEERADKEE